LGTDEAGNQLVYQNDIEQFNASHDKESDAGSKKSKTVDKDMKPKTVKEFMTEYNSIFESVSLFNLNKERPIVPLKILITELELQLARDLESGELESLNDLEPSLNPGAL
jgi:hypothetical protein